MATIHEVLAIERIDADIFRGSTPDSALQRTFGGQVAGQALVAAVQTVAAGFAVHSLHGYFIRPGRPSVPTIYLVDRVRDGRSFATRRVTGVQDGQAIFSMSASFHVAEEGPEHQDTMPAVPGPEELMGPEGSPVGLAGAAYLREWPDWEIRGVPAARTDRRAGSPAQRQVWFRYRHPLPADPVLHVCVLAYMSDMTLLGSTRLPHPHEQVRGASLDHALWFLRPFRADNWLLYDQTSPSAAYGRGLAQGRIFDRSGRLVAAVVQEGLVRRVRAPADPPAAADLTPTATGQGG